MAAPLVREIDPAEAGVAVVRAVGVVVLAFAVALVVNAAVVYPALALGASEKATPVLWSVLNSGSQFLGFILAVVGYVHVRGERDLFDYGMVSGRDLGWALAGLVGLLALASVAGAVLQLLEVSVAQNEVIEEGLEHPRRFLVMIPITILLVAPGEELVFRGAVQGLLRRAMGTLPAIAVASALFGVVHVVALLGNTGSIAPYLVVAAILGVVLGTAYELTDNLVVPMVVHGVWNALIFGAQWLAATGRLGIGV